MELFQKVPYDEEGKEVKRREVINYSDSDHSLLSPSCLPNYGDHAKKRGMDSRWTWTYLHLVNA
jgi:hypothetical protein